MSKSTLTAEKRNESLNPRQLRSEGKLPATVYGKDFESISIELDTKEFVSLYKKDKNAIFSLKVGKENFDSVVKKVQKESTKEVYLNVEFQRIKADEKVKVVVPVEVTGESAAVKQGGKLMNVVKEIEVECLPQDIPASIPVDISVIEGFDDTIIVSKVTYPEKVQPVTNGDTLLIKVVAPKGAAKAGAAE